MTQQKISLGRSVLYVLSEHDAELINRRRVSGAERAAVEAPGWHAGAQAHVGNQVNAGDVFPLIVTRVWDADAGTVNGQVLLDGSDTLWVTSVTPGDGGCHWSWPPRV